MSSSQESAAEADAERDSSESVAPAEEVASSCKRCRPGVHFVVAFPQVQRLAFEAGDPP